MSSIKIHSRTGQTGTPINDSCFNVLYEVLNNQYLRIIAAFNYFPQSDIQASFVSPISLHSLSVVTKFHPYSSIPIKMKWHCCIIAFSDDSVVWWANILGNKIKNKKIAGQSFLQLINNRLPWERRHVIANGKIFYSHNTTSLQTSQQWRYTPIAFTFVYHCNYDHMALLQQVLQKKIKQVERSNQANFLHHKVIIFRIKRCYFFSYGLVGT